MDEQKRKLLSARLSDLFSESDRGYITQSQFLDGAELLFAKGYVEHIGAKKRCIFFGGYENAERKCAFFLPEYYEAIISDTSDLSSFFDVIEEELSEAVKLLIISGSGYKKLSHRDFLGAIMNMGIDRSAVGDLCVTEENTCAVFSLPTVSELILSGLERIGADKVSITPKKLSKSFDYERKTKEINDTVASDRLDCVVSSLVRKSREKAKALILSGLVEYNYTQCEKTDLRVESGSLVTVRGAGKFFVENISEETKKGRLKLSAKKFI